MHTDSLPHCFICQDPPKYSLFMNLIQSKNILSMVITAVAISVEYERSRFAVSMQEAAHNRYEMC